jgi:hypothetical protein
MPKQPPSFNYAGCSIRPWTAEHEDSLPRALQDWPRFFKLAKRRSQRRKFRREMILRRGPLAPGRCGGDNGTMFWNEIRDHIRERLPAIVDFVLFGMAMTMIAVVLLGLSWLYVEYGMALFWLGVAFVCGIGLLSVRRTPVYFGEADDWQPTGKPSLPPLGTKQIGTSKPAITSKQRPSLPEPRPK